MNELFIPSLNQFVREGVLVPVRGGVLVLISWFGIKLYTYQRCLNYGIPLVIILVVESVGSKQTMGSNLVFLVLLIPCPRGKIFFLAWKGIYNRAKFFIDLDSLLYSRGQSVNR